MNALATTTTSTSPPTPSSTRTPTRRTPNIVPHLALVAGLAHRIARTRRLDLCSLDMDDLVSIGRAALFEAARRFDPDRRVAFPTFAYHGVHGAMLDALRANGCYQQRRGRRREEGATHTLTISLEANATICLALADDADQPDDLTAARIAAQRVRSAVAGLRHPDRRAVEAYYFEGRNLDEIGSELGTSRSWTCRILQRALATLRQRQDLR